MGENDFPVNCKKKLVVEIKDSFGEEVILNSNMILSQLDGMEKSETHIVNAVGRNEVVPTPEFKKVDDISTRLMSNQFFKAPDRCYVYDSDYFEPLVYYANNIDREFIMKYNRGRKFLKMSVKHIEMVFECLEYIVKDSITEMPTLDQLLYMLESDRPPYPIVVAIYEHWKNSKRLGGSVIRLQEYPPEHFSLRSEVTKMRAQLSRQRRNMNDLEYIKRLRKELDDIRGFREKAIETLIQQKDKQKEDIKRLRELMRKAKKKNIPMFSLIHQPDLFEDDRIIPEEPELVRKSSLPVPPTVPSFLHWCLEQEVH